MANTYVTANDCTVPFGFLRKWNGVGWKAWPLSRRVPLVSSSRPFGVTEAMPSRVRFTPVKPEYTNWCLLLANDGRLKTRMNRMMSRFIRQNKGFISRMSISESMNEDARTKG